MSLASSGRDAARKDGDGPRPLRSEPQDDRSGPAAWPLKFDTVGEDPRDVLDRYRTRAVLGDVAAAAAASLVALLVRFGAGTSTTYALISTLLPVAWLVTVWMQRGYEHRFLGTGPEEYRRVFDAGLIFFAAIAVASYSVRADVARGYVLIALPVTVALSLVMRKVLRTWLFRLRGRGEGLQKVLVVGRADAAVSLVQLLDREPQHGLVAVGACIPPVGVEVSHVHGVPVVGDPARILEAVDETGAHMVAVVSHPDLSGQALRRLSWALEARNVDLIVSPGIVEVAGPRLSIRPIAGLSLLHMERPSVGGDGFTVKTMFDRVFGSLILAALSPIFLMVALAVRIGSKGPVFFFQTRVGVDGREFKMIKFRSMVVDAEQLRSEILALNEADGVLFKMKRDPRITKVGGFLRRYSLDELPQLINVIRGDMSLVGPRPPLPEEVAAYSGDAARRLRVRPGVTGLWQVSGRSDLSWEESLQLDLRYADNWSLALDMSILWRTGKAVIKGSGAY